MNAQRYKFFVCMGANLQWKISRGGILYFPFIVACGATHGFLKPGLSFHEV
jgi:hypothetical protein